MPRFTTSRGALAVMLAAALVAGCSGGAHDGSGLTPSSASKNAGSVERAIENAPLYKFANGEWPDSSATCPPSQAVPKNHPLTRGGSSDGTLFVSSYSNPKTAVSEFDGSGLVPKPYGVLTQGLTNPYGMYVDSNGTLYIANYGQDDIVEFLQGTTTPSAELTSQYMHQPMDVAANPTNGYVYVTSHSGGPINVFTGSSSTSTQLTGFDYPTGLAFDSSQNLYVVDEVYGSTPPVGAVFKVPPGSGSITNLNLQGLDYPVGIAIDSSNDLFVSNLGGNTVQEYAPGAKSPKATFSNGVCEPLYVAVNSETNKLFVANIGSSKNGDVSVIDVSTQALLGTLTQQLHHPRGVAVNPNLNPPTTPTPRPTATPTASPTPTPKPTKSPKPTPSPRPTKTPRPTPSPRPTKTPRPTPTP